MALPQQNQYPSLTEPERPTALPGKQQPKLKVQAMLNKTQTLKLPNPIHLLPSDKSNQLGNHFTSIKI